jgi:hypothetical protein
MNGERSSVSKDELYDSQLQRGPPRNRSVRHRKWSQMSHTKIEIFQVRTPDGLKEFASLLPMQEAFAQGLAPEAIIGEFTEPITPDAPMPLSAFVRNSLFVELMHSVIAREAPKFKSFQSQAKEQDSGRLDVIDQRTRDPKGNVYGEDVIGTFEVKNGEIVVGSYSSNKNHRILSARGFFDLGAELYELLLKELRLCNGKIGRTDA